VTGAGERAAAERLRLALAAFRTGQGLLLTAHRRLKGLPPEEVEAFWSTGGGRRLEAHLRLTAGRVVAAFGRFSAAGLVAGAGDRHLVSEARRVLEEKA
jgi:hypothetical protein